VDIYGHLTPGGNRAAVNRLDDVEAAVTRPRDALLPVPHEAGRP
jgi:hypothetical protein